MYLLWFRADLRNEWHLKKKTQSSPVDQNHRSSRGAASGLGSGDDLGVEFTAPSPPLLQPEEITFVTLWTRE